jgi:hypothetical protein
MVTTSSRSSISVKLTPISFNSNRVSRNPFEGFSMSKNDEKK